MDEQQQTSKTPAITRANMAVQLPHTLQTWVGMILAGGAPQQRRFPEKVAHMARLDRMTMAIALPLSESYKTLDTYTPSPIIIEKAIKCLEEFSTSELELAGTYIDDRVKRYAANLSACVGDVSKEDLKRWIRTRTRFDLEQGAAVVVAAFMREGRVRDAVKLVKELGVVLATSSARRGVDIPVATNYKELVPLLMRVRRCSPENRCFNIPQWMFAEAGISPPAHFSACFTTSHPVPHPVAPKEADAIILSRKHFRTGQRIILHLFRYGDPTKRLRKNIKKLEDKVLYGGEWIQGRVLDIDDVALLCHYFFHFQRRLQRKVVSGQSGYGFLGKGEGQMLFQNNVSIKSTFENVLLDIAESNEEGIVVAPGNDDTLALIDQTCLLMKEYVDIYGAGDTQNLVFKKGQIGGSGRGPVDDYNLLCDVLTQLKQQARDAGLMDVPGPVRKFLAKDIMYYNNAWENDAFAGGLKAGWEEWLEKRGLMEDEE